jgi:hypothetical protein
MLEEPTGELCEVPVLAPAFLSIPFLPFLYRACGGVTHYFKGENVGSLAVDADGADTWYTWL